MTVILLFSYSVCFASLFRFPILHLPCSLDFPSRIVPFPSSILKSTLNPSSLDFLISFPIILLSEFPRLRSFKFYLLASYFLALPHFRISLSLSLYIFPEIPPPLSHFLFRESIPRSPLNLFLITFFCFFFFSPQSFTLPRYLRFYPPRFLRLSLLSLLSSTFNLSLSPFSEVIFILSLEISLYSYSIIFGSSCIPLHFLIFVLLFCHFSVLSLSRLPLSFFRRFYFARSSPLSCLHFATCLPSFSIFFLPSNPSSSFFCTILPFFFTLASRVFFCLLRFLVFFIFRVFRIPLLSSLPSLQHFLSNF